MGNGSISSSNNEQHTDYDVLNNKSDRNLSLDFQYIDPKGLITLENRARFHPTNTIETVIRDFQILDDVGFIGSNKITLVSISLSGRCYSVPKHTVRTTLHDLKIQNKSVLCFEPLSSRNRSKLSLLILFSPHDNTKKKYYEWNKKLTTIHMLLNDVIKIFTLNSIKPENIQLCTFFNENLNRSNNLEKKLNEIGLDNYHSIFVTLNKQIPTDKYDHDIYVHIESISQGDFILYTSCMSTINELKKQITRRFSHSDYINIELSSVKNEHLDKINSKRMLCELGINSDETINAIIHENLSTKQTINGNQKSLKSRSSPLPVDPHVVLVQCRFSNEEYIFIKALVTETVSEVKSKIAALKKSKSTIEFNLYSDSIDIDNKQSDRCLADFGIKPGSTIYATIADNNITDHSTIKRNIDKSQSSSSKIYSIDSKPLGLVNLGNTCFMNSALQCLLHVEPLTNFFLDGFSQINIHDENYHNWNPFDTFGNVTGAYAELIWNMRGSNRENYNYVNSLYPTRIKEIIANLNPHFATSDQQDAQEFLICLINAIHNELQEKTDSNKKTIIQKFFFGIMQSKITCLKCNYTKTTTHQFSFLPLPLTYQKRIFTVNFLTKEDIHDSSIVNVASNGCIENLVETFLEIQSLSHLFNYIIVMISNSEEQLKFDMPLTQLSENEVTFIEQEEYINRIRPNTFNMEPDNLKLEECLEEFVSLEQLDDLSFCQQSKCKRNTRTNKQLLFNSLPRVLIIQLKRFAYVNDYRRKVNTFVDFPINGLNLNNLLSSSSSEKEAIYDLIAVSNHIGSISSGHYIAYARQESNIDQWYKFDDTYVSTINSQDEIVSRDAYLLFYIKRKK